MGLMAEAGGMLALTGIIMMTSKSKRVAYIGLGCLFAGMLMLFGGVSHMPQT